MSVHLNCWPPQSENPGYATGLHCVDSRYRRKSKRLCHIDMIKEYHERNANMSNVNESRDVDNVNDDASIKVSLPVTTPDIDKNDDIASRLFTFTF